MFKINKFFIALLLLVTVAPTSTAQEKKKGGFWKVLGEVTGTSDLLVGEKIVKGEWSEYGSGAGWDMGIGFDRRFSPRNYSYTFDVTQNNATVKFLWESDTDIGAIVVSETGQVYDFYTVGDPIQTHKYQRAGRYRLIIFTYSRGSLGKFIFRIQGPVSNFTAIQSKRWETASTDFGPEGGGGSNDNAFSPRNHRYTFKPTPGSWFDVNVESNGVPIKIYIVDSNGKVFNGHNAGPGVGYHVLKAEANGFYQVYVCTEKSNDPGAYKLSITGDFEEDPKQVKSDFQKLTGTFHPGLLRHEYEIPVLSAGYLEAIYRSPEAEASVSLRDNFGKNLPWHFNNSPTPRFINRSAKIQQNGNVLLSIDAAGTGGYELLLWGDLGTVTARGGEKGRVPEEKVQTDVNTLSVRASNTIQVTGNIVSYAQLRDYQQIRIMVENLETGKLLGEVKPDFSGNYILYLPPGGQYSITASVGENRIASSYHIDLSGTTAGSPVSVEPIAVLSKTDVGSKLVLHNIFFDTGSAILLRKSYAELRRIAAFLKANPDVKVEIAGHTDSVGDDASNRALSQNRANAVLYYLQDQTGDTGARLQAKGYGRNEPISSNTTEVGRQQNRRVEFRIVR